MKQVIFFIILLLLCNTCFFPYTQPEENNYYATNNDICPFQFFVKVIDSNQGEPLLSTTPNNIGYTISVNGSAYYYRIKWEFGLGPLTIKLNLKDSNGVTETSTLQNFTCTSLPNLSDSTPSTNAWFKTSPNNANWIYKADFNNLLQKVRPESLLISSSPSVLCEYRFFKYRYMMIYCKAQGAVLLPDNITVILTYYDSREFNITRPLDKFNGTFVSTPASEQFYMFTKAIVPYQYTLVLKFTDTIPFAFRSIINDKTSYNFVFATSNPLTVYCPIAYDPLVVNNLGGYYQTPDGVLIQTATQSLVAVSSSLITSSSLTTTEDGFSPSTLFIHFRGTYINPIMKSLTSYPMKFKTMVFTFYPELPFGLVGGNAQSFQLGVSMIYSTSFQGSYQFGSFSYLFDTALNGMVDTTIPNIISINFIPLLDLAMLVQIRVTDTISGVYSISSDYFQIMYSDLVSGTLNDGYFEKVVQFSYDIAVTLPVTEYMCCDFAGNCQNQGLLPTVGLYQIIPQYSVLIDGSTIPTFLYYSFSENNITLTSGGKDIVLTIKLNENENSPFTSLFFVPLYDNQPRLENVVKATYDQLNERFIFNIHLPQGLLEGALQYYIIYPTLKLSYIELLQYVGPNATLTISQSTLDRMPPTVKDSPTISFQDLGNGTYIVIFEVTITDDTNGLVYYRFEFKNELDYIPWIIERNFSTPLVGTFTHTLQYTIQKDYHCISKFMVTYVELIDAGGAKSVYNYTYTSDEYINPFYTVGALTSTSFLCPSSSIHTSPLIILLGFSVDKTAIDVGSNDRSFLVSFRVASSNVNLPFSFKHLPWCYIAAANGEFIKFQADLPKNNPIDEQEFYCSCTLPLGFGMMVNNTGFVGISIYGIAAELYGFGGFSSKDILDTIPLSQPYLNITYSEVTPNLEKASIVPFNRPTLLTVYGRKFTPNSMILINDIQQYNIKYISPSIIYASINAQPLSPITIRVLTPTASNAITVNLDNSSIPPQSPTPNPVSCPGTPPCGGSSNGDCVNSICICKNEWRGNDCLSRTVINPEPFINTTNPTIDNGFNTTSPDGDDVQLNALISIVALQEFSFNNTLLHHYPLVNWNFTNITTSANSGFYNEYLYQSIVNTTTSSTLIKVYIQWFKQEYTVEFANQQLVMYPSTLKYRIELSPYQFESELNHLEVIFSASFENDKEDSCAIKESGSTTSESDFLKLQLNSHSLYGRFIKRAVIDGRTREIGNKFNEDSTNTGSTTTKLTESISIIVPNYKEGVSMDPDFSLLLDSNTADEKEGSVCTTSNSSKSKLTRNQLIGIIIGSVIGGIIFLTLITYFILKNSRNEKAIKIAMKMRNIGKS
ncbi:hypothetical protein DLAC_01279 [Tieghemostelium lacteum]|uniref:EGF-like domain-containing protein n=1 Tax=Tieghemostelium lacteum TaxID=361077 RepID=A0A152A871_TIELA|nr:hypothetical protein DLAC_01279 [Tieghemostelium lacteum]|eukprot:KYR02440.1 hypothetical protein DLAC_01279 [Tieghemostelium lacteum]